MAWARRRLGVSHREKEMIHRGVDGAAAITGWARRF
jgi:hypothetical protein